jgi:hypothetical protein
MQGAIAAHSDVVAAEGFLDVIQRIPDLRGKPFTRHTMDDVLVLSFGEFGAPAKGLPKSEGWNVLCRFAAHELF